MPRGRSGVRESEANIASQLEAELRKDARERARIESETRGQADEVRDFARSISPVHTGAYAAAWKTAKRPHIQAETGLSVWRVSNTDFKARWIEYGTGEPYPTEEFGVARKTAAKFGGTVDG